MRQLLIVIALLIVTVPAHAAISYDSSGSCASANTTNCTPAATTIGHLGIAFAIRSGSATAPTCPVSPAWTCPAGTPYTGSSGSGSSAISWRVGCFFWTTTSQASGTWTNAGNVTVLSYGGTATTCATVFGGGSSTGAASATLTYGVITTYCVATGMPPGRSIGLGGSAHTHDQRDQSHRDDQSQAEQHDRDGRRKRHDRRGIVVGNHDNHCERIDAECRHRP